MMRGGKQGQTPKRKVKQGQAPKRKVKQDQAPKRKVNGFIGYRCECQFQLRRRRY